jgi:DNA topoisomerase I
MKIQVALAKGKNWFDELSLEEQERYVEQHPRTRLKITKAKKTPTKKKAGPRDLQETVVKDGVRTLADGRPLPEHIQKLGIPPKWTDVKIDANPDADLLVTGRDAKGRLQPIYSERFANQQAEAKFLRVQALAEEYPGIEKQNARDRKSKDPRIKSAADCMSLIMQTGIRPGSNDNTKADKKAYGATTLRKEHVVSEGGKTFLRFTGKKGVDLNIPIDDPATAKMLRQRAARDSEELFPELNEERLREYASTLDGGHFRPKDFRTHLGTQTAINEMAKSEKPTDMKSYKKAVMAVAKKVSDKLGNTPTVALQSYINPAIFAEWRME